MKKNGKIMTALLLVLAMLVSIATISVSAAEVTAEEYNIGASSGTTGDCTWTLDDEGTLTISGNGAMENYIIINPYNLECAAPWYPLRNSINSVIIQDGVTHIGDYAFDDCTSLTRVSIGNNVTSIGKYAFGGCVGIKSVHIKDIAAWCKINFYRFDSNPLYFSHRLYLNDILVKDLIIPDSVKSINNYAFYYYAGLTSVTIGNGVTSIGNSAFYHCPKLISVTIPDTVKNIGIGAFEDCTGLISITIPDNVTEIGDGAFRNTNADFTVFGNMGTAIESYCQLNGIRFRSLYEYNILPDDAIKLTKCNWIDRQIVIPSTIGGKSVSEIGDWLFLNNDTIQSVTIPDSVTHIGKGAFYSCVELKTVTMGNNVTEIGISAFEKCLFLEEINLSDNLSYIGDEAFYDCRRLKTLDIPNSVTEIGEEAFTNCRSLTSLTIPKGVKKLGSEDSVGFGVFENCKNLQEITIPETVDYIQPNAFDGCKSVTLLGESNSYAQQYAADNHLLFKAIQPDDSLVGDVSGDSRVDVTDATLVQMFAAEFTDLNATQQKAADTNHDGKVDVTDATMIQMYAAEIIDHF